MEELYKALGLPVFASREEVKDAYYRLAKTYHPDRNVGNDEIADKFHRISVAYEELTQIIQGHYQMLQISSTADLSEINNSYILLCDKYSDKRLSSELNAINKSYKFLIQTQSEVETENNPHDCW